MRRTQLTDERGSALPLLAIVLGTVALVLSLIVVQTGYRVRVARAQWAADGSALAAAADVVGSDGGGPLARQAAAAVAEANGARLVSIEVLDRDSSQHGIDEPTPISPTVLVEVELAGIRARAAAARFAVAEP